MIPKVQASSVALEGGKALLLLLLAGLGITVASQSDLEGLYGEMDFDSMIMGSNINLDKYTKPQGEPPDYDKILKAIIEGGGTLALGFSGVLGDIKEWFQGLGATEGENNILDEDVFHFNGYNVHFIINEYGLGLRVNDGLVTIRASYNYEYTERIGSILNVVDDGDKFIVSVKYKLFERNDWTYANWYYKKSSIVTPVEEPITSNSINYNVRPGYITNGIPPTYIPQPDISDIPGIQETITPEGEKKYIYPGTMNDLYQDMKPNLTFDNLSDSINSTPKPYTLTETESGVEINTETGTIVAPFPDIEVEPETDTLTGLGKIVALLKSIINWISQIPNMIGKLFIPTEELDFKPIENIAILEKWPFSIPYDIKQVFENLSIEGQAPIWEFPILEEEIIIDFNEFNQVASLVRILLSILFLLAISVLTWKVFI